MPEFLQVMMVSTLGNFGLERRVAALSGNRGVQACALLRLGLIEQLLGQRPGFGDQGRGQAVVDDGGKSVSLKRIAKRLAQIIGIGLLK